jgi:dolichol kinase
MAKAQSGNSASSIAGKVLAGHKPTAAQVKTLAGSVLRQDETKGTRKK